MKKLKIIFLVGPTAVGKSGLAVKIAKKVNAEIISCDSMQVYRGMDILSSKPDRAARKAIRHHLLDVSGCNKEFSAALYRKLALRAIKDVHKRGKIPVFAGGSGLYMSVVIDGIFKGQDKNKALRQKLYEEAQGLGSLKLYNRLKSLDEEAARNIHPNDLKKVIRALEVCILTGKPFSLVKLNRKGIADKYEIKIFGLNKERGSLYNDINLRVDGMFKNGLVQEVRKLLQGRLSLTCKQAIGIKEVKGYLEGRYSIEEAKDLMKRNTRRYAKRQWTWFKKDKRICWLEAEKGNVAEEIINKATKS